MKKELFMLNNEEEESVCECCGGSGIEAETIDDDGEMDSSNECAACNGTGRE